MNSAFARTVVTIIGTTLSVGGCATASKDLSATYVSPMQYSSYDCAQLTAEAERIQARVVQLGGRLDQAAQNDVGLTVVGVILFWPALFALGGTKQQEAEYSRLKGEYDAVQQALIAKKCIPGAPPMQSASSTTAAPSAAAPTASTNSAPSSQSAAPTVPPPSPQTGVPVVPASYTAPGSAAGSAGTTPGAAGTKASAATSKYMFSAERFAKDGGCESPVATMTIASAASETFAVICAKADPILVRCDDGKCRELK